MRLVGGDGRGTQHRLFEPLARSVRLRRGPGRPAAARSPPATRHPAALPHCFPCRSAPAIAVSNCAAAVSVRAPCCSLSRTHPCRRHNRSAWHPPLRRRVAEPQLPYRVIEQAGEPAPQRQTAAVDLAKMVEDVHFETAPVAGEAPGLSQELLVAEVAEGAHTHGCKYNTGCEIAACGEVLDQVPTTPGRRAMAPARAHSRGVRGAQAITASRAHQGPPAAAPSGSTPSRTFLALSWIFHALPAGPRAAEAGRSALAAQTAHAKVPSCPRALVTALDEPSPGPQRRRPPSTRLCRTPSVVSPSAPTTSSPLTVTTSSACRRPTASAAY